MHNPSFMLKKHCHNDRNPTCAEYFIQILLVLSFVYTLISAQLSADIRQSPVAIDFTNVVTSQPLTNWNRDIGGCSCDLSVGKCDANCCCDLDCSLADQQMYFTGCAAPPLSQSHSSLPFCSQYLSAVNWQSQLGASVYRSSGGALCVVFANSAATGRFFKYTGQYTQDAAFSSQFALASYPASLPSYDIDLSYLSVQSYRFGDPVQLFFPAVGLKGAMPLPTSSPDSICNDASPAQFMVSRSGSCQRIISNVTMTCTAGSIFHLAYYTNGFQLVTDPSANAATVAPTINSVTCIDAITGLRMPCPTPATVPTISGSICSQMVVQVTYTFIYSTLPNAHFTDLLIDVVLGSYTINSGTAIKQTFITNFAPSIQYARTSNVIKSGTPGYRIGSPILAGLLTQSGTASAISYTPDIQFGITLPTDVPSQVPGGRSQCPTITDYARRVPITFGETSVYGCTLQFNRTAINSNCAAIRSQVFTLQTLTAGALSHVGMFGNASVENIFDWVPIINTVPTALTGTQSITDTVGTCSSILTGFDIQVLYTHLGVLTNPQRAIVGVRYSYTSGKFQWRCITPTDCVDPATYGAASSGVGTSTQTFRIRSSVSFVKVDSVGTALFSPPAPRLFTQLPNDIWYPFNL
ncbi:hypothetical protein QVD99_008186 [Batrachochytrium dendrobatidis]|nr:hypothetical protein QVD99_008186 [Batrachochytrium dendrobatidis]